MSSQGSPRQSDAVYRRRRIVVGILAVLALLGLWWLISSIVGLFTDDEPQDAASDQQAEESADDADASSAQNGSADDADSGEQDAQQDSEQQDSDGSCAPDDVTVTADTGDESYAPDEAPLLILEIENTGREGCTLDVGTAQQTFVVASGGREIFNTAQCSASAHDEEAQGEGAQNDAQSQNDDGASLEMEFEPGQTERAHLTWPRSESAADCGEPAELEPGTYELTVSLGGISSEPHEFTLAEA